MPLKVRYYLAKSERSADLQQWLCHHIQLEMEVQLILEAEANSILQQIMRTSRLVKISQRAWRPDPTSDVTLQSPLISGTLMLHSRIGFQISIYSMGMTASAHLLNSKAGHHFSPPYEMGQPGGPFSKSCSSSKPPMFIGLRLLRVCCKRRSSLSLTCTCMFCSACMRDWLLSMCLQARQR